jgi:hypothetical protein
MALLSTAGKSSLSSSSSSAPSNIFFFIEPILSTALVDVALLHQQSLASGFKKAISVSHLQQDYLKLFDLKVTLSSSPRELLNASLALNNRLGQSNTRLKWQATAAAAFHLQLEVADFVHDPSDSPVNTAVHNIDIDQKLLHRHIVGLALLDVDNYFKA